MHVGDLGTHGATILYEHTEYVNYSLKHLMAGIVDSYKDMILVIVAIGTPNRYKCND